MIYSKKSLIYLILIINLLFQEIKSIIHIYTTAFNRPDFIELQHKTFKKFLKK